jgi:hypothetical protein
MKTTADYLDELQQHFDVESDNALGAQLGMHRQQLSLYRNKKAAFDDEMCLRVAQILGADASYVMACMHWQRAKAPQVKAAWKHTAEMLGGLAAVLAVVAILPTSTLPDFGGFFALTGYAEGGTLYIMSNAVQYWPILLPLAILAFFCRPRRKSPR